MLQSRAKDSKFKLYDIQGKSRPSRKSRCDAHLKISSLRSQRIRLQGFAA